MVASSFSLRKITLPEPQIKINSKYHQKLFNCLFASQYQTKLNRMANYPTKKPVNSLLAGLVAAHVISSS